MPALFIFLLKVNIALITFCLGYYLVLRKLTFYTLNRVYLVMAIIFSSVYPLIDLNNFMLRHQDLAAPVHQIAINWTAPQQLIQQPGYWQWATIIFWLGAAVFAARLLVQFFSLYKLYRNSTPATIQDHHVRVTKANISPFSFWQNIYINPDNLNAADLKSILQHEQVHVKEWHTLDILLAEISAICYWFNPGVWLMKKAIRENIEFITDRKILQRGTDSKAYQYSLLNVSLATTTSAGISNHFNFSTLKQRIKMMNAKRSSNLNLTRYAVLLPMVTVLLLVFSFSKAELIKNNRNQLTNLITATIDEHLDLQDKSKAFKRVSKHTKTSSKALKIENNNPDYVTINGIKLPIGVPTKSFLRDIGKAKDTIRKNTNANVNKNQQIDSVQFVINGVKATKSDFVAVNSGSKPTNIKAIKVGGIDAYVTKVTYRYNIDDTAKKIKGDNHFVFVPEDNKVKAIGKDGVTITSSKVEFSAEMPSQTTDMKDKIYVVDGKLADAKEMKKLPASNIDKITVKNGPELIKEYGDDAKNGVIFITTKKAK
jgi:bla regulator protein BlaR1